MLHFDGSRISLKPFNIRSTRRKNKVIVKERGVLVDRLFDLTFEFFCKKKFRKNYHELLVELGFYPFDLSGL